MFFKRAKKSEDAQAAGVPDVAPITQPDKPASPSHQALDADKLRRETAPSKLGFKTTADIAEASAEPFEARRVWDALRAAFMSPTGSPRGHVLVTVPRGCAATRSVASSLSGIANAVDASAPDWIYVKSDVTAAWSALALPAGQGQRLAAGMTAVLTALRGTLPYLLGSEDLTQRRLTIEAGFAAVRDDAFARLHANAHAQNVAVVTTPMGFAVAPMHEGKVVKPEVLARLPQAMRDDVRRKVESVEAELQSLLADVPFEAGSQVAEVNELIGDYVRPAISAAFEGLTKDFAEIPVVVSYLADVQQDILRRACREGAYPAAADYHGRVIESVGKSLVSITSLPSADAVAIACIRAGSGAVLVDATAMDTDEDTWSALKRILRTRAGTLPEIADPVPVTATIVLLASPDVVSLLERDEPQFGALFNTHAAFAADAARSEDSESALARMLASAVAARGLLPLEAAAVAQLVAEAARLTGRPDRLLSDLTTPLAIAADASRIATLASRNTVTEADIRAALTERRAGARVQSLFAAQAAAVSGRVLALGLNPEPVEIWATVRQGHAATADIARAAPLTGDAASSASALLWSYLASRYVPSGNLSLAAAIVHEPPVAASAVVRASAAEVFALLSALAEAPVATSFAAAGWVSPAGTLLPIANINEAIESAFDDAGGRDAAQPLNIVIPRGNEAGLMLRADLVEAARKGKLNIFTAADVDEGLAILTGMKAGKRDDAEGEAGLNRRIEDRLKSFARSAPVATEPASPAPARAAPKATTA